MALDSSDSYYLYDDPFPRLAYVVVNKNSLLG